MVVIYSANQSARLAYTLDEIFTHRAGEPFLLTNDAAQYMESDGIRINYSGENLPGLQILPAGLLNESGIRKAWTPENGILDGNTILFPMQSGLGTDIFSMTFWYLSRYEEYDFEHADIHGRFTTASSVLHGITNADEPVLDRALNYFFRILGLHIKNKYAVYPTLDIDIAYKYRGKPWYIGGAGWFRDLLRGRTGSAIYRLQVLFGKTDPYDCYDYIETALSPLKDRVRFFFQVGPRGNFDKNISPDRLFFRKLIARIASQFETGLHPSYGSGTDVGAIKKEKEILEGITNKPADRSRQHFLKLSVPHTWRALDAAGITHDYTMGYAGNTGFRAGTGHSFRFYDLENETATGLVIHPFCAMDVSLKNYMGLTPVMAAEHIEKLKHTCRENGLPFCFIFHNESLSEDGEWKGWRSVFETCLK